MSTSAGFFPQAPLEGKFCLRLMPMWELGIRGLKLVRMALMDKHVVCFLNSKEVAQVELTAMKYGEMHDWNLKSPANCSWF